MTSLSLLGSASGAGPTHGRLDPMWGLVAWFRSAIAMRRTRARLSELDDSMLKDIGLHRTEIPSIAYASALLTTAERRRT